MNEKEFKEGLNRIVADYCNLKGSSHRYSLIDFFTTILTLLTQTKDEQTTR